MLKRKDKVILSVLLVWFISPLVFVPVAINQFQLFEWTESLFVLAFAFALGASYLLISKLLANVKASGFSAISLEFFKWGFSFTATGLITATATLLSSIAGFKHDIGELLKFLCSIIA